MHIKGHWAVTHILPSVDVNLLEIAYIPKIDALTPPLAILLASPLSQTGLTQRRLHLNFLVVVVFLMNPFLNLFQVSLFPGQ
jgi:hypothetical protein